MPRATDAPDLETAYATLQATRAYGAREARRRLGLSLVSIGMAGFLPALAITLGLFLHTGEPTGAFGWVVFLVALAFVAGLPSVAAARLMGALFRFLDLPAPPPLRGVMALNVFALVAVLGCVYYTFVLLDGRALGLAVFVALVAGQISLIDGARTRRRARLVVGAVGIGLATAVALGIGFLAGSPSALLAGLAPAIGGAFWIVGGRVYNVTHRREGDVQ